MTPKEGAIELVNKFDKEIISISSNSNWKPEAKQCALICVVMIYHIKMKYGRYKGYKDYWNYYSYWEEVEQEINKL